MIEDATTYQRPVGYGWPGLPLDYLFGIDAALAVFVRSQSAAATRRYWSAKASDFGSALRRTEKYLNFAAIRGIRVAVDVALARARTLSAWLGQVCSWCRVLRGDASVPAVCSRASSPCLQQLRQLGGRLASQAEVSACRWTSGLSS